MARRLTFDEKLRRAIERVWDLQGDDGGWGEDRFPDAPRSIVNTAERLEVLRVGGVGYEHPSVQRGLTFLAEKSRVHLLPPGAHPEARGRNPRYAAFALSGLTAFPESRYDHRYAEAQERCSRWLEENTLDGRPGWGDTPDSASLSLSSTSTAIRALSLIPPDHTAGRRSAASAQSARAAIADAGRFANRHRTSWVFEREPSTTPTMTALAVLALEGGGDEHRRVARAGARWLVDHLRAWETRTTGDAWIRNANWRHMTFSLGLRATLGPAGGFDPADRRLEKTMQFLSDLWVDDEQGWSHGQVGAGVTPSGAAAVVLAMEAVVAALDPEQVVGAKRSRPNRRSRPRREVRVDGDGSVLVSELNDEVASRRLRASSSQARVLLLLAERQAEQHGAPLESTSLSTDELASEIQVAPATIRRTVARLNATLEEAAADQDAVLVDLIQRVASDRRPGESRWRIDADLVRLGDEELGSPP